MSASCGLARHPSPDPCNIHAEVHNRNGHPRWWCDVHGAPAWGRDGTRLPACPGTTATQAAVDDVLRLDPAAYAGGVGLWGATSPVYLTGPLQHEWGIHVHARDRPDAPKVLDETYARVDLMSGDEVIEIDAASATAVLVANVFSFPLKRLTCPHCGEAHLDREEFGTAAHKKHQCNRCGRAFYDPDGEPSISNPLAQLRTSAPTPIPATGRLDLNQADFSGGIAIWGSNAALCWTRTQPEVEGLHIHAWGEKGEIQIDDTFGAITIDGFALDRRMVQVLMAQQSLDYLRGRITSIDCPQCSQPHFDDGATALEPHIDHMCAACCSVFRTPGRRRGVVSNPVRRQLDLMVAAAPRLRGSSAA